MRETVYDSTKIYHCALRNVDMLPLTGLYGHINDTRLHFIHEKLFVTVEGRGMVVFTHEDGRELARIFVDPCSKNGMHGDCHCAMREGKIVLLFPVYEYIDTYPNCDGEYDRWISREVGFQRLQYDIADSTVLLIREDK